MSRYNKPQKGATNWHDPLNENFDDLEIEVTDSVASWEELPAPSEVTQSSNGKWPMYRVDEDSVLVRVDDSGQHIVGGLGSSSSPVPEQHAEKLRTKDLNDIRFAEDSSEIQPAIDALAGDPDTGAPGGGIVMLRRRQYHPESPIIMKRGVILMGQNSIYRRYLRDHDQQTVITAKNLDRSDEAVIKMKGMSNPDSRASSLANLSVWGNNGVIDLVHLQATGRNTISNCFFFDTRGHGLKYEGVNSANIYKTVIAETSSQEHDTYGLYTSSYRVNNNNRTTGLQGSVFVLAGGSDRNTQVFVDEGGAIRMAGGQGIRCGCKLGGNNNKPLPIVRAKDNFSLNQGTIIEEAGNVGIEGSQLKLSNCTIGKTKIGVKAGPHSNVLWNNVKLYKNSEAGLEIQGNGGEAPLMVGCEFTENNNGIRIREDGGNLGMLIGCLFEDNDEYGIRDDRGNLGKRGDAKILIGCAFWNNNAGPISEYIWQEVVGCNINWKTTGQAIVSGDGSTRTFNVGNHRLLANPWAEQGFVRVKPTSGDAKQASPVSGWFVDEDGDEEKEDIAIRFADPPTSGTDNVIVEWESYLTQRPKHHR